MNPRAAQARMGGYANYPTAFLCATLAVSPRTVRRWKQLDWMPTRAYLLLELITRGHLTLIAQAWDGWRLANGVLHAPNGWTFAPAELLALPYRYEYARTLERRVRELESSAPPTLAKTSCLRARRKLAASHVRPAS